LVLAVGSPEDEQPKECGNPGWRDKANGVFPVSFPTDEARYFVTVRSGSPAKQCSACPDHCCHGAGLAGRDLVGIEEPQLHVTDQPTRARGGWNAALTRLYRASVSPQGMITAGEWLTSWRASGSRLRAATRRNYRSHLENHLIPLVGDVLLAELDLRRLQDLFDRLAARVSVSSGWCRGVPTCFLASGPLTDPCACVMGL
jgi:hypothetical protein